MIALAEIDRLTAIKRNWEWAHWSNRDAIWVCECGNGNGLGVDGCDTCGMRQPAMSVLGPSQK
jgi:hypothetical protein